MNISEEMKEYREWARELNEALSRMWEEISERSILGRLLGLDEPPKRDDSRERLRASWTPVMDNRRPHQVVMRRPVHAPRKIIP